MKITDERYKCILSLRVAKQLMAQGFQMVDIDMSRKQRGRLVFIFPNSSELEAALNAIMKKEE